MRALVAAPFEVLLGENVDPGIWTEVGEIQLIGQNLCKKRQKIFFQIKERLITARSRQKSYADKRRKPLEFEVGRSECYLVSPLEGWLRFAKARRIPSIGQSTLGLRKELSILGNVEDQFRKKYRISSLNRTFLKLPQLLNLED
ncbi:hypothetical protein Tco_1090442 [Tanacetum coccineum]|uniref:Reverse transcriptase domain-containing protein n=1 Tax=Tanacetum coccineum TaxID=301880 RepID=A0ABQ5I569_9ASTR